MSATDTVEIATAYSTGLRHLVGLKITMASHAASLRGFIFHRRPARRRQNNGLYISSAHGVSRRGVQS